MFGKRCSVLFSDKMKRNRPLYLLQFVTPQYSLFAFVKCYHFNAYYTTDNQKS